MRISALLLGILIFAFTDLRAQDVKIGARGGLNLAYLSTLGEGDGLGTRIAYHGGVFLEFGDPIDQITFETGLYYSSKGFRERFGEDAIFERANYVDIPLLLRFYLEDSKVSVFAGPQISFFLNQQVGITTGATTQVPNQFQGELARIDAAGVLGFTYHASEDLDFGIAYDLGFLRRDPDRVGAYFNQVIKLSIGYTLVK
ncbi:MAG: PorT family protein [Cyclobacteriaceae bacterium]|nr:PorT family protein [Cyclobacteriaceae bacterium]MCH8516797.1 PorT family protein [Cyclobacteriaceae bacterium]